jgi:uncharacterized protein
VAELTGFAAAQYDRLAMMTCPTCRQRAAWHGNVHRPFCSLSCRLVDLGAWLDGRYRIPTEPETGASEDVAVENDVS